MPALQQFNILTAHNAYTTPTTQRFNSYALTCASILQRYTGFPDYMRIPSVMTNGLIPPAFKSCLSWRTVYSVMTNGLFRCPSIISRRATKKRFFRRTLSPSSRVGVPLTGLIGVSLTGLVGIFFDGVGLYSREVNTAVVT